MTMNFYRMAWAHTTPGGFTSGSGPESRHLTQQLLASVRFGNRNHGEGSHWIEKYENGAWTKMEDQK